MRVGVNCFLLQPHIGGLKQYFINLFDWLFEYDRENEYTFFYFAQNAGELAKLRSDRWKQRGILLESQEQIAAHLKDLDLYFCPFSALWPRPVPLPSVMTLVDIQEVFYPEFFKPDDLYNREYHYPASTRAADRVLTISEFSKMSLVEHHGISPEKVRVAYLCADPLYFDAAQIQKPPDTPIPFSQFVFFPANRWFHKNHDVLLRALAALKDRGQEANAVFTGFDVEGGYPIGSKAQKYGVAQHVHSAGYVTVPQMAYLYRHAEMLVFPSLFEGFGMPPIEAMAAGCPAVVSTSTCLPEICGGAAEYFDPQDPAALAEAIARVRHPARRDELVRLGSRQARSFSAERTARVHLEAFAEAASEYSKAHFLWHSVFYQPYHTARIRWKYARQRRREARRDHQACSIRFPTGWHFREQDGPNWLRWTEGKGQLTIRAPRAMQLRAAGEVASVERPNEITVSVNGSALNSWTVEGEFGFRDLPELTLPLRAGNNVLEFVSSRPGVQCSPSDPRKLAIAIRNLRFSDAEGGVKCTIVD